ncbi:UNVERIFIED_CONTAM: hypothetical protein Q9R58_02285 [Methylobacteriaceae bacterium AG10]|nr:hypothetical protein [Methylobacteriaceae bacterium AG10]
MDGTLHGTLHGALVGEHRQIGHRENDGRNHEGDEDLAGTHGRRLLRIRLAIQCNPAAVEIQIVANATVPKLRLGALATPKLMAVTGVTPPITTKATATLLRPVARSFVCSLRI